uniref:Resistance to inhibitors of cholinesterase protein 3 N-terminal domain-containing protein n=1 Tax=Leptobrachium leishanense TaxID=445787 RepID=A0A8C5QAJ3_9ANUR
TWLLSRCWDVEGVPVRGNAGHFPSVHHPKPSDVRPSGSHFPRSHLSEAVAKAKGGNGGGGNGRQSLVGQIIPIYGFGILLYILYILFKLSSRGKSTKLEQKSQPISNGNLKRKITDYELGQLQDKLKETEEAMEKIISRMGPNCDRSHDMNLDEERQLLQRLKEITRVMKEGKVLDGVSPEQEAEEAPYMEDWQGYPEETFPVYEPSDYRRPRHTVQVDHSQLSRPTAEELAEQMEFVEDDHLSCGSPEEETSCDLPARPDTLPAAPSSPPRDSLLAEKRCNYDDDDDENPAVVAENAGFHSESSSEQGDVCSGESFMESNDERELLDVCDDTSGAKPGALRKRKTGNDY